MRKAISVEVLNYSDVLVKYEGGHQMIHTFHAWYDTRAFAWRVAYRDGLAIQRDNKGVAVQWGKQ